MSKNFTHKPQATISKKVATDLNLDHALAKRLVDIYNDKLYLDVPNERVKAGSRASQILLALSYTKLAHLQEVVIDNSNKHSYLAACILSAAGYCRATGHDAIVQELLK